MHEMSLALEICRIAERAVGQERAGQIVEVGVRIGDDAGVEPENLAFCLEVLLSQPPFTKAVPRLIRQPGDVLRVDYLEVDDGRPHD
jgi:Zn finger protein HypA/HybF involved in hydrogenase expression